MRRFTVFFILICFAATFFTNSVFMLSIERGKVYTENYNLSHIIKAAYSSTASSSRNPMSGVSSCRFLCHRHIKVTKDTIPEKHTDSTGVKASASVYYLPAYSSFFSTLTTDLSKKQFDLNGHLKRPITSLLQSPVLLI